MSGRGPRIRGHHLICLQFFHGQGFSVDYARNLFHVIDRLTTEAGEIVVGPDDVCAACTSLQDGRCSREPEGEDEVRILDALALELLDLAPGDSFNYGEISVWVPRILERWHSLACDGCDWEAQCAPLISLSTRFPTDA